MIITLHWAASSGNHPINNLISKDKVVVSRNSLINEPSLKTINIPNNARGKQLYVWLLIKDETIKIIFSGLSNLISTTHPEFANPNHELFKILVSDSPFTIRRGLITKNIYDLNSDALDDVKEFEKSEGTII